MLLLGSLTALARQTVIFGS